MNYIANLTRPTGDPKVLRSGPSSLKAPDRLGRALGWFSIGLGLLELLDARRVTRTLGMEGSERLVRLYGLRELGAGFLSLSVDKEIGLKSRVAGDGLDIVTLLAALRPSNPKAGNAGLALAAVVGITVLDVMASRMNKELHSRGSETPRNYGDRSGFPQGIATARGAALAKS
jgi:hypothetical protein